MTVASGRSRATEWYSRENEAVPAELKVFVTGSYRSACLPAWSGMPWCTEPPPASTVPLGRMTAVIWMRPVDILGPDVQRGDAAERSMISVVLVAGSPTTQLIDCGG